MNKPESVLENKTYNILLDFEIKNDKNDKKNDKKW